MTTRLPLLLTISLISLVAVPVSAQQTSTGIGGGASSAAASPYIQQRSKANTSFDNPYAPGGIYDPYRTSRPREGQNLRLGSNSKSAGLGGGQKPGRRSGSGLKSGSDGSSGDKTLSSGSDPCGGRQLGRGSMTSGMGMNRPRTTGSSSGLGRCGGLAGNGNSRPGSTSGMSGTSRRQGSSSKGASGLSSR